ncbi:hypothetical protein DD985_18700 [Pseudomonas sp. HMWF011]|nr:hypothetical protein DBR14_26165 [Pseudomonas sp. HMWF034]PVV68323.1 hypothetical protein DD985_18700 [Pseudomonas sp. HMWF011]
MDGQRAVFERGMLAQQLLLFREPARPKRYMNMPPSLAPNSLNVGSGLPAIQAPCSFRLTEVMPSQASQRPRCSCCALDRIGAVDEQMLQGKAPRQIVA